MKSHILRYSLAVAVAFGLCSPVLADHHKKPVDLVGVWKAIASSDAGDREITWTFKKEGDKLTGTSVDGESGDERTLDRIKVEEKKVLLEIDGEQDGNKFIIKVAGEEKEANKLTGKWSIEGTDGTEFMSGDFTAVKEVAVAYAGEWQATSVLPDGSELSSTLNLKGENAKIEGHIESSDGNKIEVGKIKADSKSLRLEFELDIQGNTMDVVIEAEPKKENKLVGKWIVKGDDGNEAASGDWSAIREVAADYSGEWAVTAVVPDSDEYTGTLTLKKGDDGYTGTTASSERDPKELNSVKVEDKNIVFTVDFDQQGVTGVITVKAEEKEDGSLAGTWSLAGSDGNEVASDSWAATKSDKKKDGVLKGR